ncbi:MAG: hypothetical protein RM368_08100 [Nostoc sp. DedSLP03]|uniref:hypothetical protein n=1 Tax=Nostoc sp. DedSLP03 TaxID=3075400 RepID=UPI002AD3FB3D|nr:hypothetical protein [Nostoc sp. DedSLP03]MDZ7964926.1 hypothetical protein [Nostoc sp. DedSLP03]
MADIITFVIFCLLQPALLFWDFDRTYFIYVGVARTSASSVTTIDIACLTHAVSLPISTAIAANSMRTG